MKVCVIGNSHAAALKSALDAGAATGRCAFDFYVVAGGHEPQLAYADRRLRPLAADRIPQTTIAGAAAEGLDLSPFDAVVVSACGLFAARNENIVFNPAGHPLGSACTADWLGGETAPWPAGTHFVSAVVFGELVAAHLERHCSVELARLLARVYDGKVILQPWPAPSVSLRENSSWFVNVGYGAAGPVAWRDFIRAQYRALEGLAGSLGARFALLPYPFAEPLRDGFIGAEFCSPDPWHANAAYGALVVEQIRDLLA